MGFFIRPGKKSFRIVEEVWTPHHKVTTVPKEAWPALGFRYDMSLEEAKDRASQINKQSQLEAKKIANTKRRQELQAAIDDAYIPEKLEQSFCELLETEYEDNPDRLATIYKHWNTAKKLIAEVQLDPKDYFAEKALIFNYYKKRNWSPDYIKRITRILNQWGAFYARKHNSFFQEIPSLTQTQTQKIVDLRDASGTKFRAAAKPLMWTDLQNAKTSFQHAGLILQWNWLFIGLWFGLRPTEIDNLKIEKYWKVTKNKEHAIDVLEIYQTKLTSLPREQRWKQIPIYQAEQKEAMQIILTGEFERPLVKTIALRLGTGHDTYSPRKGFTDLMLNLGYTLDDVALFLGHESIDTTWKSYKNKKRFKLPNVS
jgi:integrase